MNVMTNALSPRILRPEDRDPRWRWDKHIPALGHTAVDFERRVDHDRLRKYRLSRTKAALKESGCGALLLFDVNNIRYVTGTKIGEWERDKMCRFALLAGDEEPYVWDFGSAAVHHKLYCDWLDPDRCRAGVVGMRGTIPPSFGLMKRYAEEIAGLIRDAGLADMPIGLDYAETAMFFALQDAGLKIVDGQQIMLSAREIKNIDEIQLLNQAASMVDGVYHMIWEELKPGVRENDIVALSNKLLYELGSDDVEAINAISGERCNPHPHNFTDRIFRPGDQAFFDILHSYQGYRTCYYRTFNLGRATASPARRVQAVPRVARQRDQPNQARRHDRCRCKGLADRGRASASRTNCRPSASSSAMVSALRCMSGRSSAGWSVSKTRWRSRPGWSLRSKPIALRRTAIPPPASRRKSSSPTRAAPSSAFSRRRSCRSPINTDLAPAIESPSRANPKPPERLSPFWAIPTACGAVSEPGAGKLGFPARYCVWPRGRGFLMAQAPDRALSLTLEPRAISISTEIPYEAFLAPRGKAAASVLDICAVSAQARPRQNEVAEGAADVSACAAAEYGKRKGRDRRDDACAHRPRGKRRRLGRPPRGSCIRPALPAAPRSAES